MFTELAADERQLSRRQDMVSVKNPFDEDFICKVGGQPYGIRKNSQAVFPFPIARFIADRIVDAQIYEQHNKDKKKDKKSFPKRLRDQRLRSSLMKEVFIDRSQAGEVIFQEEEVINPEDVDFGAEQEAEKPTKKTAKK